MNPFVLGVSTTLCWTTFYSLQSHRRVRCFFCCCFFLIWFPDISSSGFNFSMLKTTEQSFLTSSMTSKIFCLYHIALCLIHLFCCRRGYREDLVFSLNFTLGSASSPFFVIIIHMDHNLHPCTPFFLTGLVSSQVYCLCTPFSY